MLKQVYFDNWASYDDFNLYLSSYTIGTPTPKNEEVEIEGADGKLDLSDYFGEVKFDNRSLKFNFSCINHPSKFNAIYSKLQNMVHGQKMRISHDDDKGFYYIGRVTLNDWETDKRVGSITIECDCEPYKYKQNKTIIPITVNGNKEQIFKNLRKTVIPTVKTDAEVKVGYNGESYSLSAGTFQMPEIAFKAGDNVLTFEGNANVIVEYQEAGL